MSRTLTTTPPEVSPSPRAEQPRLPLIFTALILAMLMSSLGQMVFSAALPTIVGELGGVEHMTWVITAFLLGQTISLPIFGKLGDQFGRKYLGTARRTDRPIWTGSYSPCRSVPAAVAAAQAGRTRSAAGPGWASG